MIHRLKYILPFFWVFFLNYALQAQLFTISGRISDSITGNPLQGANIFIKEKNKGTVSNSNGEYYLHLNEGRYKIWFSYLGYSSKQMVVNLAGSQKLDIFLNPLVVETDVTVITNENPRDNIESLSTGRIKLSAKELQKLPSLMGESDLMMAIHYTPGVQSMSDGNSGFHVRGGSVDQNLILLDNATIFNPSHILGFFSVFNTDVIKDVELIKSGMPLKYGGRISSVLQVNTKDGNMQKATAGINTGLISSKIVVEVPILKEKISVIASFRRTYLDEIIKPIFRPFIKGSSSFFNYSRYHFYDFNSKLTWVISKKHRIHLMAYDGEDFFKLDKKDLNFKNLINWGNKLYSLTWNYSVKPDVFFNNSLSYNDYSFLFEASQNEVAVQLFSQIKKLNYRSEFIIKDLRLGFDGQFNYFIPNKLLLDINNLKMNYSANQELQSTEISVYSSYSVNLRNFLEINGGLRYTNFLHLGPYTAYKETATGVYTASDYYDDFSIVKPYNSIEPRFTARFPINDMSSVKASYSKNYQYIHIASASAVTLPSDIWIPSSLNIKPQHADHYSIGYYRNFIDNMISASIEAYYKDMKNQIELLYGIGVGFQEKSFEKSLTMGKGSSKGIELMIEKNSGKATGWLGYTLSRTNRKFPEINDNKVFPAKYDRRHDINLVLIYDMNERWNFSSAFVYATGNAMSLPKQRYIIEGKVLNYYGQTNSFRMPAYHRLDVSATYRFLTARRYESSLNFSVFNVYNRANPFYIYFEVTGDVFKYDLKVRARQISLFPVIPSVSWNIKF
ncbi:MAG: TonB-dependent receptor [Bacteroidales bacterium]